MKYRLIVLIGIALSFTTIFAEDSKETLKAVNAGCPIWVGVVLGILCVVLVAAVAIMFMKIYRMEDIVRKQSKTLKSMQKNMDCDKTISDEGFKSLREQTDLMMKLIKSSASNSNEINNQKSNTDNEFRIVSESSDTTDSLNRVAGRTPNEVGNKMIPKEVKEVFFGSPREGLFCGGLDTFKPGVSMYCIKDNGLNEAIFTIVDRKEAKNKLKKSITSFLEPACEVIGNTNDFEDIVVKQTGVVKRTYDGWKIIKKALVEVQ